MGVVRSEKGRYRRQDAPPPPVLQHPRGPRPPHPTPPPPPPLPADRPDLPACTHTFACRRPQGRDALFDNLASQEVDPRNLAQRIMDIRSQLAEEFIQDLKAVAEENSLLLRWGGGGCQQQPPCSNSSEGRPLRSSCCIRAAGPLCACLVSMQHSSRTAT